MSEEIGEFKAPAPIELPKVVKKPVDTPDLQYTPPSWACTPAEDLEYQFDVIKNGKLIESFDFSKRKNASYLVVGRLPDHPSISRYHCILQYGEDILSKSGKGWHLYDMGSTHLTKINKNKIPPKQYMRAHVGFIIQFGGSTRIFNLAGPSTDSEPEWECSPTEMRMKMHKKVLEAKLKAAAQAEIDEEKKREEEEDDGACGWGMDYGENDRGSVLVAADVDAHLMEDREAYYKDDPRKALAKFFDREGFDMNFEFNEQGQGHTHKWVCSIELPVEIDGIDRNFTAQATVATSKKDAMIQCALEACKILDGHNVLRRSNTSQRQKRKNLAENDFYDDDDDLFYDRTGQIEEQRDKREKWSKEAGGKTVVKRDTYESLCEKLEEVKGNIESINRHLEELGGNKAATTGNTDDVDDYVRSLERGAMVNDQKTKIEKSQWRQKLVAATHERQRLEALCRIAKPVTISLGKSAATASATGDKQAFLRKMMAANKAKKEEKQEQVRKVEIERGPALPGTSQKPAESSEEVQKLAESEKETKENVETPHEEKPTKIQETPQEEKSTKIQETPREEKSSKVEDTKKEAEPSLKKRVAEWEAELEAEKLLKKSKKSEPKPAAPTVTEDTVTPSTVPPKTVTVPRVRKRDVERKEKRLQGTSEDYGHGYDDKDEKYATWMPPEQNDGNAALRAKFAGRY